METNENNQDEMKNKEDFKRAIGNILTFGAIVASFSFGTGYNKGYYDGCKKYSPEKIYLYDWNKDGYFDITYEHGEIYLHSKEGGFTPYEKIFEQKKAKIDSIYKVNPELIINLFENKLEKEVK